MPLLQTILPTVACDPPCKQRWAALQVSYLAFSSTFTNRIFQPGVLAHHNFQPPGAAVTLLLSAFFAEPPSKKAAYIFIK